MSKEINNMKISGMQIQKQKIIDGKVHKCVNPECVSFGKESTVKFGIKVLRSGKYQQYRCGECGSIFYKPRHIPRTKISN